MLTRTKVSNLCPSVQSVVLLWCSLLVEWKPRILSLSIYVCFAVGLSACIQTTYALFKNAFIIDFFLVFYRLLIHYYCCCCYSYYIICVWMYVMYNVLCTNYKAIWIYLFIYFYYVKLVLLLLVNILSYLTSVELGYIYVCAEISHYCRYYYYCYNWCIVSVCVMYTVFQKGCHQTHGGNFVKSQSIFKILSPLEREWNLQ